MSPREGGKVIVDQLRIQGIRTLFTVPGESFLPVLEAVREQRDDQDSIELVVCRHEAGAAIMAEAQARLTGRPAACFVTRGPGATHASIAVHNATFSNAPLLLLIAQVPRAHRGRRAFQEIDHAAMFAPLAKHAIEVSQASDIPTTLAQMVELAMTPARGPVVAAFPSDVLSEMVQVEDAPFAGAPSPLAPGDVAAAGKLLVSHPHDKTENPPPAAARKLPNTHPHDKTENPPPAAARKLPDTHPHDKTENPPPAAARKLPISHPHDKTEESPPAAARKLLISHSRPMVLVGGGIWSQRAADKLAAWAEANHLPVAATFRRQDYIDNRSPSYVGYAGVGMVRSLAERIRQSDLILAIGTRLGDTATRGYTLLRPPVPDQCLIHVHPDANELGKVYTPHLAVHAQAEDFVDALAAAQPLIGAAWGDWCAQARDDYLKSLERVPVPGDLDLWEIMAFLRKTLPPEAVITKGAGNFTLWPQRYRVFQRHGTQLGPQSGAMGYAIPAAIGAKSLNPKCPVVAFTGDGDFLMTGQEIATAVQYNLPIVVLVFNNGMFGTIRAHQERMYPGCPSGTYLRNPDFAAYARAFGAFGATVKRTEEFAPAFEAAMGSGLPAVLDMHVHPAVLSPGVTLEDELDRKAGEDFAPERRSKTPG